MLFLCLRLFCGTAARLRQGATSPRSAGFDGWRRQRPPFARCSYRPLARRIPHRPGESLDRMEKARYNMYVRLKRECFARSLAVIHKLTQGFFLLPAPPYWRAVFEKAARVARCFLRAVCCMGIGERACLAKRGGRFHAHALHARKRWFL